MYRDMSIPPEDQAWAVWLRKRGGLGWGMQEHPENGLMYGGGPREDLAQGLVLAQGFPFSDHPESVAATSL